MKKILIIALSVVLGLALLVLLFFLFLTVMEYYPKETVPAELGTPEVGKTSETFRTGKEYSLVTWNMGYAGLGKDQDFFMDGGKNIQPDTKEEVQRNMVAITNGLKELNADIYFIQEIDRDSQRSYHIDEAVAISNSLKMNYSFAYNYKCIFVPIPFPPIGKVSSGIAILTAQEQNQADRIPLPVSFSWPSRTANLKRCILVSRLPVEGSDKELVLVNFHLEAYDEGEGKIAQTKLLMSFLQEEYAKGNYVISGGDWNQMFPETKQNKYPPVWPDGWQPGEVEESSIPAGWKIAVDDTYPTCRSIEYPYNDERAAAHEWQYYVIDGFLLSPNVTEIKTQVLDKDFQNSDHNPVKLQFKLN